MTSFSARHNDGQDLRCTDPILALDYPDMGSQPQWGGYMEVLGSSKLQQWDGASMAARSFLWPVRGGLQVPRRSERVVSSAVDSFWPPRGLADARAA